MTRSAARALRCRRQEPLSRFLLHPGATRHQCGGHVPEPIPHQSSTQRAETKELERFFLWAVALRGNAFNDLRVDDCEAHKDFMKSPDLRFVGERFADQSPSWRSFASSVLSSVCVARRVRVAGRRALSDRQPMDAVDDPPVSQRASAMKPITALL